MSTGTGRADLGAASQSPASVQERLLRASSPPACLKLLFSLPPRRESAVWCTSFPQPGALPAELHRGHPGGHGALDEVSSDRNWDDHHQIRQVRGAGQLPKPHPSNLFAKLQHSFFFYMIALKLLASYAHLPASGRRLVFSGCPRGPNCEVQKVTVGLMCCEIFSALISVLNTDVLPVAGRLLWKVPWIYFASVVSRSRWAVNTWVWFCKCRWERGIEW